MRNTAGCAIGALIVLASAGPALAGGYWDARGEALPAPAAAPHGDAPAYDRWREGEGWSEQGDWDAPPLERRAAPDWDDGGPDVEASIAPEDLDGGVGWDGSSSGRVGEVVAPGVFVLGFDGRGPGFGPHRFVFEDRRLFGDRRGDFGQPDFGRRFVERQVLGPQGQLSFHPPMGRALSRSQGRRVVFHAGGRWFAGARR
ncbi:MAG: hypothetical protein JO127_16685 [Caulobacteraceae bacterium]|nr:hypothetical protein [Caulobacteraceae bacterium]